jgi:Inositol hexakisphosphate
MKGRHRLVARSLLVIALAIAAASPAFAGTDQVTLILNAPDNAGTPRNYRAIKNLGASGSGQFSAKELDAVRARTGGRPLVVLDLRQESHGFVDGTAVSWFGARDAANGGKSAEQIGRDESALLAGVAGEQTVTVQKVTGKTADRTIGETKPVELPVQTVQSEEDVVRAAGGGYVRVYAADYQPFTDEQVDQLAGFWQTRPADAWVHVHCAAGQGRTTQALVMFDMLENATTTSLRDIVDRQHDAGGINVLPAKSTPDWRHDGEVARARLVRRFYEYAKEHPRGEGETWSSWSARNP